MHLIYLFLSDWGIDWRSDAKAAGGQGAEGALQAHHQALRYSPHHRHQPDSIGRLSLLQSCLDSCKQCSGSGIRDTVPFWPLDPDPGSGSGIGFSRIPNPYFWELSEKFLGKKFYNSLTSGPNFFLQHSKNKIIFNFVKFVATKKCMTTNFFSPLSFITVLDPGSEFRDPEWVKN